MTASWPPATWEDTESLTPDADKLGEIYALVSEHLRDYPGEDVLRLINKLLDILTETQ